MQQTGSDSVGPWGCCHLTFCRRRQRRALQAYFDRNASFSVYGLEERKEQTRYEEGGKDKAGWKSWWEPGTRVSTLTSQSPPNININMVAQRLQYLELFMKEYVVDTKHFFQPPNLNVPQETTVIQHEDKVGNFQDSFL